MVPLYEIHTLRGFELQIDSHRRFKHSLAMSGLIAELDQALLLEIFEEVNKYHFDGFLDPPHLTWNMRLRSSAGRFFPGRRRRFFKEVSPRIEVAAYLMSESNARDLVKDTIAHEMIHYWLWVRRRPFGHTPEFHSKMREMGVSRYNPVPRARPHRYVYQCVSCLKEYLARRKLGPLACAECCRKHAQSQYDARFKLVLQSEISISRTDLQQRQAENN